MASTKLTNWIKEQIVRDLLAHRFTKACDKLVVDRAAFAQRVYNDVYSPTLRKKMAELPAGWLPELDSVSVQFGSGGGYEQLPFCGSAYGRIGRFLSEALEPSSRRFLASQSHGCIKVYELDHTLSIAHEALDTRKADLVKQIDDAERQANSALNSVSTIGRLIDIWPEIEPFATKYENAKASLPALPTAALNALLDLPVAA